MKIIDEKGKLFGKVNLIDLLVAVILIAALAFVAYKFTRPDPDDPINGTTKLTFTTQVNNITPQAYQEVLRQMELAGGTDQLMANGELVDAYVLKAEAFPHINYQTASDGTVTSSVEKGDDARVDVVFTVEANVVDPITNKVGTQEVRVGKNHILKTVHFEFQYSTILTCDWG